MKKDKLKNKVGPWVDGDEFWNREEELESFRQLLEQGENLLLVAPRRVGKTSLIRETLRRLREKDERYGLFIDLQRSNKPEDIIVELAKVTREYAGLWNNTKDIFKSFLSEIVDRIDSIGISDLELSFRQGVAGDWQSKGSRMFEELAKADKSVILFFDEFPVMVNRLLRGKDRQITNERITETDAFLSWLRQEMGKHQGRISFVICGSIGLEPILNQAKLSNQIAHLRPFHLSPWSKETADSCLKALAKNYELDLDEAFRAAMLDKLGCYIPQHVQMFFGYIHDEISRDPDSDGGTVSISLVDKVYNNFMLGSRGHAVLSDYEERLHRVLDRELVPLAIDLLTESAISGGMTRQTAMVLAQSARLKTTDSRAALMTIMGVLEHDGFVQLNPKNEYVFVSKFVCDWWVKKFHSFYIPPTQRGI